MPRLVFVLNNIRSAWNVGAILRTADALGADVVLIGYTPQPAGSTLKLIKKTAIGAEETVSWRHFDTAQRAVTTLRAEEKTLHLAIEISAQSSSIFEYLTITDLSPFGRIYLWLGNEISGIERDVIDQLDGELHLPMKGMKESLNVASTACTVGYLFAEHSS
jgi:23S rRNA (guanosine2251-2'-O)-methyltransferase